MNREFIIDVLQKNRSTLGRLGVLHAGLFGSVARGEQTADSDVDIIIELDPLAELDIFRYAGLKRQIAELFSGKVDIVNRQALKPGIDYSKLDIVDAF